MNHLNLEHFIQEAMSNLGWVGIKMVKEFIYMSSKQFHRLNSNNIPQEIRTPDTSITSYLL